VTVPTQRAWGWDYPWQAIATTTGAWYATAATSYVVGVGGFSVVEPEPAYQKLVSGTADYHGVKYLTPTDYQSVVSGTNFIEPTAWDVTPTPPVVSGSGSGRAEPDLSANTDPESGYLLYEPSFAGVGQPTFQSGWGGTSFVAPQFNGSTAVIESYLGHRIGLWKPERALLRRGCEQPGHAAQPGGHRQRQHRLHGEPRPALQRGDRPRRPEPCQVRCRPHVSGNPRSG